MWKWYRTVSIYFYYRLAIDILNNTTEPEDFKKQSHIVRDLQDKIAELQVSVYLCYLQIGEQIFSHPGNV